MECLRVKDLDFGNLLITPDSAGGTSGMRCLLEHGEGEESSCLRR